MVLLLCSAFPGVRTCQPSATKNYFRNRIKDLDCAGMIHSSYNVKWIQTCSGFGGGI